VFQQIDLRELSQPRGPERAFLSYYGAGGPGGIVESRERALRALLADDPDEAEHFQQNLDLLRAALGTPVPEGARSLCAFVCFSLDLVRTYPLAVPVPDLLRVDAAPYIRPWRSCRTSTRTSSSSPPTTRRRGSSRSPPPRPSPPGGSGGTSRTR
jgi:hypothetical protein